MRSIYGREGEREIRRGSGKPKRADGSEPSLEVSIKIM